MAWSNWKTEDIGIKVAGAPADNTQVPRSNSGTAASNIAYRFMTPPLSVG